MSDGQVYVESVCMLYTVTVTGGADKDSPWSSKKAVSSTKLSSSLANAKGDLFLSPEVRCIGVIRKELGAVSARSERVQRAPILCPRPRRSLGRMPPLVVHPEDVRQGYNDIDDSEARRNRLEDSSEGDHSDDIHSDGSEDDFTRVEDEDWEIAERGTRLSFAALLLF